MISEKKEKKICVRMSECDYDYLHAVSYMAGMTVSQYVRILVQATVSAAKVQEQQGAFKLEDLKAIFDN